MYTLGSRVKLEREKTGLTQEEVAKATEISRSNISKIEKDIINPNCNSILALAVLFNVTTDWLIVGKNNIQHSGTEKQLTDIEQKMLELFNELPSIEQGKILGRMETTIEQQDEKREKSSTCTNGNDELSATSDIA